MGERRRLIASSMLAVAIGSFVVALSCSSGCSPGRPLAVQHQLEGATMGTTYSIRYLEAANAPLASAIQQLIDTELLEVNRQMSTYLPDSEISVFNASSSTDWMAVSQPTAQVVELAQQIAVASEGAFDVTVAPLVNLWGFGPAQPLPRLPADSEVAAARALVGYQQLAVRLDPPGLKKSIPNLQIDLSAIAKGHGVDRVGGLLASHGIHHYFVEIGGEIATKGTRSDGKPWRVGIEAPQRDQRAIQSIVGLSDAAIATSGDYRNYYERDGQSYSHTIDPRTGFPVTHQLAAASVIANNCALADAIATCMMVLGPEAGLKTANTNDWAVLLLRRDGEQVVSTCSSQFVLQFPEICDRKPNHE